MIKYAKIINETTKECSVAEGNDINFYRSIGMTEQDVEQSEKNGGWYLQGYAPHYTPEEKEALEKARIGELKCTKRVLVLLLEQLQYNYFETIQPLIEANRQAKLEWELCVELQRKNPLLDLLGGQLGITPLQIDNLFKFANGEITEQEFRGA